MIFEKLRNKYDNLSKTHKKIADYIFNNYRNFAFSTLEDLSKELSVSPASIYRFTKELGFNGFPEFKKHLQKYIKNELTPMKELRKSIEAKEENDNILYDTIDSNIEILESIYSKKIKEKFKKIILKMKKANKIYIFALRSTFTTAYYFNFMLNRFLSDVELLELNQCDLYDKLQNIGENDLLFTLCFSPYTNKTIEVLKFFNQRKAYTIAISDAINSPLLTKADLSVNIEMGEKTYSFVSVMTFLNAIVVALGRENREKTIEKLKFEEKFLKERGVYFQEGSNYNE